MRQDQETLSTDRDTQPTIPDLFSGGGELGARMRSYDWAQTPLGPVERWSQSLKTAVRIMLTSRQPIWLGWGAQLIKLYNDPYKAIVGGKHPHALGQPASVVWHEIWDAIGPMLHTAMGGVEGTYVESQLLIMERNGYPEETYYTFSYSPIPNDEGSVGGIICANTDDTARVIGERQLALLRELAARTADARTLADACTQSVQSLATNPHDIPFALLYLVEPKQRLASLAGITGIAKNHAAAPPLLRLDDAAVWPVAEVLESNTLCLLTDLTSRFDRLPTGAWPRPPQQAVVVPIAPSGQTGKAGVLVVGLNPFRLFDDSYRGFITLVAGQIAASIANAQAYAEERRRAEALAELDRAKTAFFSNVSHEFRTPLALMLGPLEDLLADAALPESSRIQLDVAHRNALRLLKLVNTLLDFSRLEAGRMQASFAPTDLAALTVDLVSMFRAAIERAGLRLIVQCSPLAEPVYVDRELWEQIVFNLLSNAVKFTFAGEIAVGLRSVGAEMELTVRDTGTGIPAEELPQLFERFHRVKGARGRTFEGSGIGLALVQELVALHGGTINVESVIGQGSTFRVAIPFGSAHLPAERIEAAATRTTIGVQGAAYVAEALRWLPEPEVAEQQAESAARSITDHTPLPSRPATSVPRPRILLADDNADMRDYIRRFLSAAYEVVAVADGAAALQAARTEPFDLVLSDVMMPQLDGFGLLAALRADEQTKALPVLLLSARAGEEARVEGMDAGADDYLVKPFSARELLARVSARLEIARIRKEAETNAYFLAELSECIRVGESAADLLRSVVALVGQYLRVRRCYFAEIDDAQDRWLIEHDYHDGLPSIVGSYALSEFPQDQANALRNGQVLVADAASTKTAMHQAAVASYPQIRFPAYIVVPYRRYGCWLATLVAATDRPRQWRLSEQRLLETVAERVWLAVERLRLEAAQRDYTARLQQLNAASVAISVAREYGAVLRQIVDEARALIGANQAVVNLVLAGDWAQAQTVVSLSEQYAAWQAYDAPPSGAGIYRLVYDERRTLRLTQVELEAHPAWHGFGSAAAQHPPLNGLLAAPLIDSGGLSMGVLQLSDKVGGAFTAADEALLQQLAQLASVALENQALYDQEQAARAAAEEANRLKDEFLATVSHELRTPLTAFLGYAQLLQSRKRDEAYVARTVEKLVRSAKDQAELIDDLLDVSRIVSGKLRIEPQPVDLVPVIHAALDTVRPAVDAKSLRLDVDLNPEASTIMGDPSRMQQVVWNLLSNAAKFTPSGGTIRVWLEPHDSVAQLSIRDSGQGISAEFLPFVFERFRQAESTSTRAHSGLGLGLAIVRHLVELHGGTVSAASDGPGQGATFTVQLPLAPAGNGIVPNITVDDHQDGLRDCPPALRGLRVLIVDDQPDILELLHDVLAPCGVVVQTCATARAGLETIRTWRPDVLLSDIAMPGDDGYWLIQEVRALAPADGGTVPAIALTAYVRMEDRLRVLAAGYQHYVPKPIEPAELRAIVAQLAPYLDRRP